jgi:hypothetical protein
MGRASAHAQTLLMSIAYPMHCPPMGNDQQGKNMYYNFYQ